eukprot:12138612-Alexandrium_andersonii.AAC.1
MGSSGATSFAPGSSPPAEAGAAASFLLYSAASIKSQSSLRTKSSGVRSDSSSDLAGTAKCVAQYGHMNSMSNTATKQFAQ